MKNVFLIFVSLFAAGVVSASPVQVSVPFQRAYIPGGFDSNDVVEFVVEGAFPNSCYRPGFTGAVVTREGRQIQIRSTAFLYSGLCLDVIIPFNQTINLGVLEAGRYDVVQPGVAGRLGELRVREATTNDADDFLYAPISQAMFQPRSSGGDVILTGEFTSSCMTLDRVLITVENSAVVVQPIARLEAGSRCQRGSFPFQRSVTVRGARPGRYVLHIRSMNGNAINSLIDIR